MSSQLTRRPAEAASFPGNKGLAYPLALLLPRRSTKPSLHRGGVQGGRGTEDILKDSPFAAGGRFLQALLFLLHSLQIWYNIPIKRGAQRLQNPKQKT